MRKLLLAGAVALLVTWADRSLAPASDQPWLLRWVRIAAGHPVRLAAAAWLLLGALSYPSGQLDGECGSDSEPSRFPQGLPDRSAGPGAYPGKI